MTDNLKRILPNFFLVGAAKAGTTSLYHFLKGHPDVYMPSIKEPNYFSTDIIYNNLRPVVKRRLKYAQVEKLLGMDSLPELNRAFIRDWDLYLNLFEGARGKKAVGESSVSYLFSNTAAKNIADKIPGAKIIIILRNPVERAYSHYLMDRKLMFTSKNFYEAWQEDMASRYKTWGSASLYIETGLYYQQVKRYLDFFPKEQIKIFLFDSLKKNPLNLLSELYDFINVKNDFVPANIRTYNSARIPKNKFSETILRLNSLRIRSRKFFKNGPAKNFLKKILFEYRNFPPFSEKDKIHLKKYFIEDIKKLESMINIDLSEWIR